MTTTASAAPGLPRARAPRVLLAAVACVIVVVVLTAGVAGLSQGPAAARGTLVGGGIACAFFFLGSFVVNAATRLAPQAAMAVALMTYTFQVALVAMVFIALGESDATGELLSSGWLAGGVITATAAWTVGQLVATAKARIPAYDIELPGPVPASSQAPVPAHEVGAS